MRKLLKIVPYKFLSCFLGRKAICLKVLIPLKGGLSRVALCGLLVFYCLLLLSMPGCSHAQKQIVEQTSIQAIPHPPGVEIIEASKKKKVFDFVRIDGVNYAVPIPWRGRRLQVKPLIPPAFKMIPVEFSYNGKKLYILIDACDAFVRMAKKAKEEDITLLVHSGYRSIWYQKKIFKRLMAEGRTWEDVVRYVAPPGYSEHMLGTVVDLYPSNWSFASTPAYKWLEKHAPSFGFSETYPKSGQDGFPWEPWHWKFASL